METNLRYSRLGSILVKKRLISKDDLAWALASQKESGIPLGRILVDEEIISEKDLAKTLALQKNLDVVDLEDYEVDTKASVLIPVETARRYKMLPIGFQGGKLLVAMANPLDVYAIDTVQVATGKRVELVVATESAKDAAITEYVGASTHQDDDVGRRPLPGGCR